MMGRWIKLWDQCLHNGWLQNPKLWTFWTWCLLKAAHRPTKARVGYQEVFLEPGELVFSLAMAKRELRFSIQEIRTILTSLQNSENLTHKATNKYSVISIVNWQTYQSDQDLTNTQDNKRLTSNQQATNKQQSVNVDVMPAHSAPKKLRSKEVKNKPTTKTQLFELPDWVDESLWEDLIEMRKALKPPAPNTPGALKQLVGKLTKLREAGNNPSAVLAQSIERGWRGVFEVKDNGKKPPIHTLTEDNNPYRHHQPPPKYRD